MVLQNWNAVVVVATKAIRLPSSVIQHRLAGKKVAT
jgi:hypothetical protein